MIPLPKYETIIRELTYAIRDLASAAEVATYRTHGGGPVPGRVYSAHDEANAMKAAEGRLAGALNAASEHCERLAKDVMIVDARAQRAADRLVRKATKQERRSR